MSTCNNNREPANPTYAKSLPISGACGNNPLPNSGFYVPENFQAASSPILLHVESDKGFYFTYDERTDKTLTASVFDVTKSAGLQLSGYEYRFEVDGVVSQDWSTTRTFTLSRQSVNKSVDIGVLVRNSGGSVTLRKVVARVYDVPDVRSYKLYSTKESEPNTPAEGIKPDGDGDSDWSPNSANAIWVVDGQEKWPITGVGDIDKYSWGGVYRVRGIDGEDGDDYDGPAPDNGEDGLTPSMIFIKQSSAPSAPEGDSPEGWSSSPPSVGGSTDVIWVSVGQRDSEGSLSGAWSNPIRFNGYPGPDRPMYLTSIGNSSPGVPPSLSVTTSEAYPNRRLQSLVIENNWSENRWFLLRGEVTVHEDSGDLGEAYDLLFEHNNGGALPATGGDATVIKQRGPYFVTGVGIDEQKYNHIDLHGRILLDAGQSLRVYFSIRQVHGTLGKCSVGYLEAIGL